MSKPATTPTKYPGIEKIDGGRWYLTATFVTPAGKRLFKRQTFGPCSLEDAVKERADMVTRLASPEPPPSSPRPATKPTLSEFAARWLASKRDRLKASARAHYLAVIANRINPALYDREIDTITRADVDAWARWIETQRNLRGEPYSTATLGTWWRPICTMLRDAAADHDFPDPTNRVRPPKGATGRRRERRTLTAAELRALVDAATARHPAWAREVQAVVYSGMRPGELYALEVDDIDEAQGVIHVTRAVWRGNLGTTKTDDPRDVALTPALRVLLRVQHEAVQARGFDPPTRLVFPADDGRHRGASALYKVLRQAGEAAGLPMKVGPQVLRRTFNTLLVQSGAPGIVLRAQMGHTDEAMTARYTGVHPAAKAALVEALEDMVRGNVAPDVAPGAETRH